MYSTASASTQKLNYSMHWKLLPPPCGNPGQQACQAVLVAIGPSASEARSIAKEIQQRLLGSARSTKWGQGCRSHQTAIIATVLSVVSLCCCPALTTTRYISREYVEQVHFLSGPFQTLKQTLGTLEWVEPIVIKMYQEADVGF